MQPQEPFINDPDVPTVDPPTEIINDPEITTDMPVDDVSGTSTDALADVSD